MKKVILSLSLLVLVNIPIIGWADCFLAKENNQVIANEGNCKSRHAPCSTFKIAISLM